jgi:hypothetical protein
MDTRAISDTGKGIRTVKENSLHANSTGTNDIQIILIANVYGLCRLNPGFLQSC